MSAGGVGGVVDRPDLAGEVLAPGMVRNGEGDLVYTLKHPVVLSSKTGVVMQEVSELVLRRLKGRQLRAVVGKTQLGLMLELLAASSGMPAVVMDELDGEDVTDAGLVVMGFFASGLATGGP